jgi:PadR family transcriptional regulator, regulatory protein PadR
MDFRSDLEALVLATLERGASHGYDIGRAINQAAEGSIRLKDGQLYPVLHRLENEGWISAEWVPQEGKPSRKVYALSDEGRRVLETKREGWRRFTRVVDGLLTPTPSPSAETSRTAWSEGFSC